MLRYNTVRHRVWTVCVTSFSKPVVSPSRVLNGRFVLPEAGLHTCHALWVIVPAQVGIELKACEA